MLNIFVYFFFWCHLFSLLVPFFFGILGIARRLSYHTTKHVTVKQHMNDHGLLLFAMRRPDKLGPPWVCMHLLTILARPRRGIANEINSLTL